MTTQEQLVLRFKELTAALENGKYGNDDDIDFDCINDDLDEILTTTL